MSNYFVAFDCETGGLDHLTTDLLTAYFAIVDEEHNTLEELDLKLKPNDGRFPIANAKALKVNKIDLKMHLEDPTTITYSEAKPLLVAMLKRFLKKKGSFSNLSPMGHNVPFDRDYVTHYILPKEEWDAIINYRVIDTMPVVNFLKRAGWLPKEVGSLESIAQYLNIVNPAAHTAKADTKTAVSVDKALLDLAKAKKNSGPTVDLISLLEKE